MWRPPLVALEVRRPLGRVARRSRLRRRRSSPPRFLWGWRSSSRFLVRPVLLRSSPISRRQAHRHQLHRRRARVWPGQRRVQQAARPTVRRLRRLHRRRRAQLRRNNDFTRSRSGGIGRHVRLRGVWGNPWGFESPLRHLTRPLCCSM